MSAFVCPPGHDHTRTKVCYVIHKCRCAPCREHSTAIERDRRRRIAYGTYDSGRVPADPVREHIEYLRASGMGWKRVAEVAGVSMSTVSNLIYGRRRNGRREFAPRVLRSTADAILAVEPTIDALRAGAVIPNVGFRRRAEALAWVGHSFSRQADALGITPGNFGTMLKQDRITAGHHLAMRNLFDQWWDSPPPAGEWHVKSAVTRTRNHARLQGFAPPLAWDDIDDPAESPEGVAA